LHAVKVYRGIRGIAPLILNLGTRWSWMFILVLFNFNMYFFFLYVPYFNVLPSVLPQVMPFAGSEFPFSLHCLFPLNSRHCATLPYLTDLFSHVAFSYIENLEANSPRLSYLFTKLCGVTAQKIFIVIYCSLSDILDHLQNATNCMIPSTRLSVLLFQLVTTCSSV